MHVEMSGNTSSGSFTEIDAHVEPLRCVDLGQGGLAPFHQVHHFVSCLFIGFVELGDVFVRHDHEMAGPVRIDIKNNKIKPGSVEDEFLLVAGRAV